MNVFRLWPFAFTMACVSMNAAIPPVDAADDDFAAIVERRVRDWQPTKDERLLDQVGWASDLVEAKDRSINNCRFEVDKTVFRENA